MADPLDKDFSEYLRELDRRIEEEIRRAIVNAKPEMVRNAKHNVEDLERAKYLSGQEYNPEIFEALQTSRAQGREESKSKRKSGPRGPRPEVIKRRLAIKYLYEKGIKGRKACAKLTDEGISLPTKELQIKYRGNWLRWYEADKQAVYRQISTDRKRALPFGR
jgi:hypothetical protein